MDNYSITIDKENKELTKKNISKSEVIETIIDELDKELNFILIKKEHPKIIDNLKCGCK